MNNSIWINEFICTTFSPKVIFSDINQFSFSLHWSFCLVSTSSSSWLIDHELSYKLIKMENLSTWAMYDRKHNQSPKWISNFQFSECINFNWPRKDDEPIITIVIDRKKHYNFSIIHSFKFLWHPKLETI